MAYVDSGGTPLGGLSFFQGCLQVVKDCVKSRVFTRIQGSSFKINSLEINSYEINHSMLQHSRPQDEDMNPELVSSIQFWSNVSE